MEDESTHQYSHENVRIFNPDFGILAYHENVDESYFVKPLESTNWDNKE